MALRIMTEGKMINRTLESPLISIHNFGPIKDFSMEIKNFNILTGPQASGKSTVAKVLYFCQTIKNEIYAQMTMPQNVNIYKVPLLKGIEKRLRGKFLRIFGSTWAMPMDMRIIYTYRKDVYVEIYLEKDHHNEGRNFVKFVFSQSLYKILKKMDKEDAADDDKLREYLNDMEKLFGDSYESIYIPAGRGMITLLTDQLNYIFSSTNDIVPSTIDYCTRSYVERILQMRPLFSGGLSGLLDEKLHYTQDRVDLAKVRTLMDHASRVLKGTYYYASGEERLAINDGHFVKINYASSGQQEAVWIFNMMFYYLLNHKRVFLILEEPEAHLFPEAQYDIAKAMGVFSNEDNRVTITTHSPYMLGALNNMLYAAQVDENILSKQDTIKKEWILQEDNTTAFYMFDGKSRNAMEDGLILNELIDGASKTINEENDEIMEYIWRGRGD